MSPCCVRRPAAGRPPGRTPDAGASGRGGAERRRLDVRTAQLGNGSLAKSDVGSTYSSIGSPSSLMPYRLLRACSGSLRRMMIAMLH
jgi:hypothetical protein